MWLISTRKKCPLCSRLSSRLKEFFRRIFRIGIDCQGLHLFTYDKGEQRIPLINSAAPDCHCENYRMSRYSPGVIESVEQLTLYIFHPLQQLDRNGKIKSNAFSHAHKKGRSIQRDTVASSPELVKFVSDFLENDSKRIWKGVVLSKCEDVRKIKPEGSLNRSACVYDTAEKENPAHGEIGQTQHVMSEEDLVELRHALLTAFGGGVVTSPTKYRNGAIWNELPNHLQRE